MGVNQQPVGTEELIKGGRIELENFLVLETQTIDRGENSGAPKGGEVLRYVRRVSLRMGKRLKAILNTEQCQP